MQPPISKPNEETIVALATPPGRGGVGIIRLSGPGCLNIARQLSQRTNIKARQVYFCTLVDRQQSFLDSGLLLYFKAPHSFTGEDVVEFQMHGSPVMLDQIMQECLALGARMAQAGEFSKRAFLNDKMDLTQAEAIADLIDASSLKAAQMASRSLQGEFSQRIGQLNAELIQLRLYVEAAIDFPDEDIDFISEGGVLDKVGALIRQLTLLRQQAGQGVLIREGLTLVIAGHPNAGKSTLINHLAKQELSIVSDIAGTTRDIMRAHVLLDDLPLHILDTAGLHDSQDPVEQEGIKRAWQVMQSADIVVHLCDIQQTESPDPLAQQLNAQLPSHIPLIRVINKMDLENSRCERQEDTIYISAKSGQGISQLVQKIKTLAGYQPAEGLFLARRRHLEALDKACDILSQGLQQLMQHQAAELLAEDLRYAHTALADITGQFSADDLLGHIFSSFCIGK
ncbi:MAG: tRNA uridine-5-carboxymethylaminomethyl(34) synthesis GTPase MnmE [Legionellaceae bacterium]|nr:tRNA uridine-5-carboxymethylaminomethyl(34) synthesis GTPase MnmE [Legionellaceae bacterium]